LKKYALFNYLANLMRNTTHILGKKNLSLGGGGGQILI